MKMEPRYYQLIICMIQSMVVLTILFKSVYCIPALPWECPSQCTCDEILLRVYCSASGYTRMPKAPNNTRLLFLEGNPINIVENDFFVSMNNLRLLSLANNEIDEIQEDGFKSQRKVVHLDLSRNLLGEVPVALNSLRLLKELIITDNELRTLSKEPWSNLSRLTTLMLDTNHIPNIPLVMISTLQRLTTLSMSSNAITSLIPGQFLNLTDLEYLDLSNNQIGTKTDLSKDYATDSYTPPYLPTAATDKEYYEDNIAQGLSLESFKGLVNLIELNLAGNMILQLQNGIFTDLHNLEVLNLSSNGLENIQDMVFREQYKLQILTLSDNDLEELQQVMFEDLRLLQILRLDNNNLVDISPLTNIHMFHLKTLHLNNNRITAIEPNGFQEFKTLEEIHLQGNKLKHVPKVGNLTNLRYLDLSNNKIKELTPVNVFDGTDLQSINLRYNRLTSLSLETFTSLKNLADVYFDENPYVCDCRLQWIMDYEYDWLEANGVRFQVLCESPTLLSGYYVAYSEGYGLKCSKYIPHQNVLMLVIIWGTLVLFILISFWIYTYFNFKRKFNVRIPRKRYLLLQDSEKVNSLTGNHVDAARFRTYDTESESYIYDEETTV